jgi:hypothetical protein
MLKNDDQDFQGKTRKFSNHFVFLTPYCRRVDVKITSKSIVLVPGVKSSLSVVIP